MREKFRLENGMLIHLSSWEKYIVSPGPVVPLECIKLLHCQNIDSKVA